MYKTVTQSEFLFTWIASAHHIGPKLLLWKKEGDSFVIQLESYSKIKNYNMIQNNACELVRQLHQLGIFHGDINQHQFVTNQYGELKLIHFKLACWIDEIKTDQFQTYHELARNANHLIELEVQETSWQCGIFKK